MPCHKNPSSPLQFPCIPYYMIINFNNLFLFFPVLLLNLRNCNLLTFSTVSIFFYYYLSFGSWLVAAQELLYNLPDIILGNKIGKNNLSTSIFNNLKYASEFQDLAM